MKPVSASNSLTDTDKSYLLACSEIKDKLSAAHQMASDSESHKIIDWIWDEVKSMEVHRISKAEFCGAITKIQVISSDDPKNE
jgi:hypothetical protein